VLTRYGIILNYGMDILDHFSRLSSLAPKGVDINRIVHLAFTNTAKDSRLKKELHSVLKAACLDTSNKRRGQLVNLIVDFRKKLNRTFVTNSENKLAPKFYKEIPLLGDMDKLFNTDDDDKNKKIQLLMKLVNKARELAQENKDSFYPGSPGYRPEVLFYATLLQLNMSHADDFIRDGDKVLIPRKKMIAYLNNLDSLFNSPKIKDALNKLESSSEEMIDQAWLVQERIASDLNKVLEDAGIFACISTEGQEYYGVICKEGSFTRKVGSLDIPVNNVVSLKGNMIGEAYAREGRVVLPLLKHHSEVETKKRFSGIVFQEIGLGEFDFNARPDLMLLWVFTNELSRVDSEKELQDKYIEHVLSEELSHAYSQAYTQRMVDSKTINTSAINQELVNQVLKKDTEMGQLYADLMQKFPSLVKQKEIATGFFEFEGQLDGLTNSPYTLRYLYESFGDVLFPFSDGMSDFKEELQYDISRVLMAKFLTEEFIPNGKNISKEVNWDKLFERSVTGELKSITSGKGASNDFGLLKIRKAWLDFFNAEINTREKFHSFVDGKSLSQAASRVKERFYLTIDEREKNLASLD